MRWIWGTCPLRLSCLRRSKGLGHVPRSPMICAMVRGSRSGPRHYAVNTTYDNNNNDDDFFLNIFQDCIQPFGHEMLS